MSIDVGGAVRRGEELDAAAVHRWLAERLPDLGDALPEVTQYAGGASNWTYRLRYPRHDLVLRRPPAGHKAKSAHDMGREVRVQSALRPVYPYVPEIVGLCEDEGVIGTEFYVMRRIEGIIPRKEMPVSLRPAQARALCSHAVDRLVELHRVDVDAAGLRSLGKGTGYVRRQIEGWSDRWRKARTPNVPSFERVIRWLHDHMPDDVANVVIHNDFRLDNLVLDPNDPTRPIGVLDWEMSTLGDPLMDLGNSLAYWVQADDDWFVRQTRRQPTNLPGMMTREELVRTYAERSGREIGDSTFYEVYGMFRLAVIVQQIYWRYHHGQTDNPAFRRFWLLATWLDVRCARRIGVRKLWLRR